MREVEEKAYKEIPLAILKHVAAFCHENGITYSLHYGTLLGAVRHKGYIPWDDDIDIVMPRKDYEKFRKLYRSERYPLIDLLTDMNYSIGVAKVYDNETFYFFKNIYKRDIGLFIDVFVLDNMPDDAVERKKWLKRINRLKKLNSYKGTKLKYYLKTSYNWKIKLFIALKKLLPISQKYLHKQLEKTMRAYEDVDCQCVCCPIDIRGGYKTFAFPKDLFEEYTELSFEGEKFMATKKYDEVLKILYGDYMKLPPVEEQVGKHGIIAYYKNSGVH